MVGGGSRYESDEEAGAFHFIEHLCFKGTPNRPTPREISETIEGVGGVMNASTDREITTYWCKVARPHFDIALDLLVDMVCNPLFDATELEKERSVILEELAMSNAHPDARAGLLIDETMWPNQALGRDVGGSHEAVSKLNREAMMRFVTHQYVPSNAVVSVAGNVSHEEVVESFHRYLGDWATGTPLDWYPVINDQTAPRVRTEYRKSEQAHICLGLQGLSIDDPNRYASDMLSTILGEGMSSRLFLELREERGLVYEANSGNSHYRDTGSFEVYAAVDPKNAAIAIETILVELEKLKAGIPESELTKSKEFAKGRLLLRMEDTRSVALWLGSQALMRREMLTVDEVVERIDSITTDDLHQMARELIVPERMNMAVVGPFRSSAKFETLLGAPAAI